LAKFVVCSNYIEIAGSRFAKNDQLMLRRKRSWLGANGIELIHPRRGASLLTFWSMDLVSLESALTSRGYQVASEDPTVFLDKVVRESNGRGRVKASPILLITAVIGLAIAVSGAVIAVNAMHLPAALRAALFLMIVIVVHLTLMIWAFSRTP
jgi:hypothetical protein